MKAWEGIKMHMTSAGKTRTRSTMPLALVTASAIALSGCAGPVIGALTLAEISTIAGLASTLVSGQDLTEHALSLATGEDCRILEAILRENRDFCEEHGSTATADDFEGVVALLEGAGQTTTALANARHHLGGLDPMALGFAPIDRSLEFSEFSLEMVEDESTSSRAARLSFGFMSASFGQSWAYELTAKKIHQTTAETPNIQLALADLPTQTRPAPQPLPARRADGQLIIPD